MLVNSRHNGIYERILTAKNGQLVRVQFAVVEVGGMLRGRVISVTPIVSVATKNVATPIQNATETAQINDYQLYLPGTVASDIVEAVEAIFSRTPKSPYVSFEFFMSQPTRAPSL